MTRLSIDRCPVHGFWAVCIGDEHGGKRPTPSKCCGSWTEVARWNVTADDLREMANELECQAIPNSTGTSVFSQRLPPSTHPK